MFQFRCSKVFAALGMKLLKSRIIIVFFFHRIIIFPLDFPIIIPQSNPKILCYYRLLSQTKKTCSECSTIYHEKSKNLLFVFALHLSMYIKKTRSNQIKINVF